MFVGSFLEREWGSTCSAPGTTDAAADKTLAHGRFPVFSFPPQSLDPAP